MNIDLTGDNYTVISPVGSDWLFRFALKSKQNNQRISLADKELFAVISLNNNPIFNLSIGNGIEIDKDNSYFTILKKWVETSLQNGQITFVPSLESIPQATFQLIIFVKTDVLFRLPIQLSVQTTNNIGNNQNGDKYNTHQVFFEVLLETTI